MSFLDAALALARLGLSVIPLHSPNLPLPAGAEPDSAGKRPLVAWREFQERRATEDEIRQWWSEWPTANIGVVTGAISGVVVVDVDGPDGQQTLRGLHPVPVTWRSATGRWVISPEEAELAAIGRGEHLWFRHPGGQLRNFAKKAPGLDFRGDGGYVVAPPSPHRSGVEYRWVISPEEAELADAPRWLFDLLAQPIIKSAEQSETGWWLRMLQGVPQGERHQVACQIAGHYLGVGWKPEEVEALLLGFAAQCRPPHDSADIRGVVKDLAERERQKRAASDNGGGFGEGGAPGGEGGQEPTGKRDDKTDWGNAQRLVRCFGDVVRWCEEWNCWLIWNGLWWVRDRTLEIERKVKETVLGIYREASEAPTKKERRALAQHAMRSESSGKLGAVAVVAKSEPGIPVLPEHLDRDPWKAGCLNGTLDLRTGDLVTPRKEDMITRTIPVAFDPSATCPLWERFLETIVPDPEVRAFLQRAVGCSLTGDSSERVLFILYGMGSNGKSTFLNVLRSLLGDYAAALRIQSLLAGKQDQTPADLADARGARFVTVSEYRAGQLLAEEFVKMLTGRDPVRARRLYENFFTFIPEFKLWFAVNYKPNIKEAAPAIWDRIRLVPFEVRIEEAEQDKHLEDKLKAELPGVLNWALRGCLDWQQCGLGEPAKIIEATKSYRKEQDLIGQFLDECCEGETGHPVTVAQLYAAYVAWCQLNNETPVPKRMFGSEMARRGYPSAPVGHKRRYKGITLKSEAEQELFRGPSEPSREREPGGDDVPF